MNLITQNFTKLSKNIISFSAICNLIENGVSDKCEDLLINFFSKLEYYFLTVKCLLRILKSITISIPLKKINFITEFIINNLILLVKSKQGYILIREYCKLLKDQNVQMRIIHELEKNYAQITSSKNGCLLCQCILRNFDLKEPSLSRESLEIDNKIKLINKKLNIPKEKKIIHKLIDNLKSNQISNKLNNIHNNNNIINNSCNIINQNNMSYNFAMSYMYDLILKYSLQPKMNKQSFQIIICAISYGGPKFHSNFIYHFINNKNNNHLLSELINDNKGIKLIKKLYIESNMYYKNILLNILEPIIINNGKSELYDLILEFKTYNNYSSNYNNLNKNSIINFNIEKSNINKNNNFTFNNNNNSNLSYGIIYNNMNVNNVNNYNLLNNNSHLINKFNIEQKNITKDYNKANLLNQLNNINNNINNKNKFSNYYSNNYSKLYNNNDKNKYINLYNSNYYNLKLYNFFSSTENNNNKCILKSINYNPALNFVNYNEINNNKLSMLNNNLKN